jgi:hypothetical protein
MQPENKFNRQQDTLCFRFSLLKKSSVASVRKRTIPTERLPLVSEVSANFLWIEGCHVVNVTNGPLSRPTTFFLLVPGNRTRDPRICSQEL